MTQEQEHFGGKNDKRTKTFIPEPYAESNAVAI